MDRRSFITWATAVGATLSLPANICPTKQWKPAQQFWVSHRFDWISSPISDLFWRESKEMFVPVVSEHPPPFGYGTQWERIWKRDMVTDFSLGKGLPDAAMVVEIEKYEGQALAVPSAARTDFQRYLSRDK